MRLDCEVVQYTPTLHRIAPLGGALLIGLVAGYLLGPSGWRATGDGKTIYEMRSGEVKLALPRSNEVDRILGRWSVDGYKHTYLIIMPDCFGYVTENVPVDENAVEPALSDASIHCIEENYAIVSTTYRSTVGSRGSFFRHNYHFLAINQDGSLTHEGRKLKRLGR
jgi:hypothetical protein